MAESGVVNVLAKISRELWIVTASDDKRSGGLIATWVTQASLDANPAVFVVSLAVNHFTRELVDASQAFSLHLISQRHSETALRFASNSGRDLEKLAGIDWVPGATGAPRLTDVVAWLDCKVIARFVTGDRVFYWAEVVAGNLESDEVPLTDASWIPTLSESDRKVLGLDRQRDIELQRPPRARSDDQPRPDLLIVELG